MFSPTVLLVAGILFVLYIFRQYRLQAKLPPGPPRLPIIGNLHQAPKSAGWLTYQKWVDQYGPLVSADFGGTNVIIVGDYATAKDLLDKRGNIYSGRPRTVMAQEMVCKDKHIMLKNYDENFLLHQRLEAPVMSPRASTCYTPVQDLESKQLLKNLLNTTDYPKQYERFSASLIYVLTYGMRILTCEEWQMHRSHECMRNFLFAGQLGRWIVDALPILNHLPASLAPWKKTAEDWYQLWTELHEHNFEAALKRDGWNWTKDFKNAKEAQSLTDIEIAWDLGIMCDAANETTNITLQIFTLACLAHPEWIPMAQKEIEDVVGSDRLPTFEDLNKLPYIQAVIEETFRWRHLAPTGVPHAAIQDDWYKGYFIPKGSVIVPLFSAMRQDERLFDSPLDFRPERWIGKTQSGNFGYGRRVCPGRFIARNSVAIAVARLLWAFNIRSKDGRRQVVEESMFSTGFVSIPKPLEAVFEPRSEARRHIIEEAYEATDKDVASLLDEVHRKQVSIGLQPRA
ncbi:cytochrome P450 [Dothidotthia symphoricarpi CBS 119687]|uniref:Cytochrome P450 n=1 Tax=Dothidotthia symphoricarpi CBS 119687 TaxID=1392245 RepID=A0A6A6ACA4_9PLEO|nr:cytochrome P450 [Dothidotthia symphoricarpi CBS 119687]KAF2128497.1 cytochrome P450 [Dothidotthia symphoricarpi CBS 119687]